MPLKRPSREKLLSILLICPLWISSTSGRVLQTLPSELPGELRVLTYNIHHGEGMDGRIDLARIARVITSLRPDLVALQEVDVGVERTSRVDQAATLAEMTGLQALFGPFMDYQGGRYGMAILTRLPVVDSWNHHLPEGAEPRTALTARLRLEPSNREFLFVGVHLYKTESERLCQARRLVDLSLRQKIPVLIAGDFNSEPNSPVLQLLGRFWTIPPKGEENLTFPADSPDSEIDYILLRPGVQLRVLEQKVIRESQASDHRPVFVRLQFLPGED